jgi:DNA-binding response OmpR family regulator
MTPPRPRNATPFPASEASTGTRRTSSGVRRATRRPAETPCATLLGAGSTRLNDHAESCGWHAVPCSDAADLLDRSETASAVILTPSDAEHRAALNTLSALRNSGFTGPVLYLLDAGERRDVAGDPRVVEAHQCGASLVLSQAIEPANLFVHAACLLPTEARQSLTSLPPPSSRAEPRSLRHGRLRIKDGNVYQGKTRLALKPSERQILLYFLEHKGRFISQDEVEKNVLGGVHISEGAFRTRISVLRKAIGDEHHTIIQTNPSESVSYGIGV